MANGRARRGSQRQLQSYVNDYPAVLSDAILGLLPERLRQLGARINWVSPLARDGYREYRDREFLQSLGLGEFAPQLAEFWPDGGPCWDALGMVSHPGGEMKRGVILIEAKSHIREIYGNGCQASPASLLKIEAALHAAQAWCGVPRTTDWLGPLYQSANRIAHLYFLVQCLHVPAWLVNVYFTGDPIGSTDRMAWEREAASVKQQLGLSSPVPNLIEVHLPALGRMDDGFNPC